MVTIILDNVYGKCDMVFVLQPCCRDMVGPKTNYREMRGEREDVEISVIMLI